LIKGSGIFPAHNTDEILKITKGIKQMFDPKYAYSPIINAGMKGGILAARKRAPKKTHAMERSTDYIMKSPTNFEAFVGVHYGLFQDQGTRYISATFFFSGPMEEAFLIIGELIDKFHTWQVQHHFAGWQNPQTINLSGTVSGTSRTTTGTRKLHVTIKQKRLTKARTPSTVKQRRLKRTVKVKTTITPRRSSRKAGM